ncbi:MAG: aminomethyl transferase family protein [Phycisphaerae bacterium]|nr:aminomethyl transferase family protein [Phycisphaerae bacterium]
MSETGYVLDQTLAAAGARLTDEEGITLAADYGDPAGEYAAALSGAGLYAAQERGLIEVTGPDRAGWLSNLVTNAVQHLEAGQGTYTFAVNVQGRILFDANVLALPDAIWLDVDRRLVDKAIGHLERHLIMERVTLRESSDAFTRVALLGPRVFDIAEALGATHARAMAALGATVVPLRGQHRLLVRHDELAGVPGLELYVEPEAAVACWRRLLDIGAPVGLRPVGRTAVQSLRIEAGIPVCGEDLDDTVLPAETGQIKRAVSYSKGCYLGQEVVERMRSHGNVAARRLVGLRFASDPGGLPRNTPLFCDGKECGRLTSRCYSFGLAKYIGLGFVRSAQAAPGTIVTVGTQEAVTAEIAEPSMRPATTL